MTQARVLIDHFPNAIPAGDRCFSAATGEERANSQPSPSLLGDSFDSSVIDDVPPGKKFYGEEVTHRGRLQYSEDEVQRTSLELTIG
jgi:hypothetical protein